MINTRGQISHARPSLNQSTSAPFYSSRETRAPTKSHLGLVVKSKQQKTLQQKLQTISKNTLKPRWQWQRKGRKRCTVRFSAAHSMLSKFQSVSFGSHHSSFLAHLYHIRSLKKKWPTSKCTLNVDTHPQATIPTWGSCIIYN